MPWKNDPQQARRRVSRPENRLGRLRPMQLAREREQARHRCVDLVIQRRIITGPADGDAVSRPGELEVIDCGVADGGRNFCRRYFAWLVPSVGKCGKVAVTP